MISRDLIPLLIALQHNSWFTGVCGDGVRPGGEAWEALCRVVRCAAPAPQNLSWRGSGLRHDHAARLGHALLRARAAPSMHTVDFSQNHIEDKGTRKSNPQHYQNNLGMVVPKVY